MDPKPLEMVVETPAVVLEKTLETTKQVAEAITDEPFKRVRSYWKMLGPGLTTGAADDDPSGIATYSQSGAQYGFQLIWLSLFTFPLMAVVQEMCARIGLVTGRGLAANIRFHFPRWLLYLCTLLLFGANTLNLGADLGAMAQSVNLVFPSWNVGLIVVALAVLCLVLEIFTTYEKYAKYLKWLALILLSYVFTAILVKLDWVEVIKDTLIPTIVLGKDQIILICAVLGTTISPYLFFWQTSQEIEEEILEGKTSLKLRQEETTKSEIKEMRIDVWSGMFLSNLVMFFIIATCSGVLNKAGITNIQTAADAANALRPLAGEATFLLFALGILGTGLLAVPVLAGSASYAISESFGWKYGLYRKLKDAYAFYGVIIISTILGLIINFVGIDPIKALLYSAVVNGIISPVILFTIVVLSSSQKVMGNRANSAFTTILGWSIVIIMTVSGVSAIISLV